MRTRDKMLADAKIIGGNYKADVDALMADNERLREDNQALAARLAEVERKLVLIAAHTGHNTFLADRELLSELLIKIQRICNAETVSGEGER